MACSKRRSHREAVANNRIQLWGLALLSVLSFMPARMQYLSPWKVIVEHVLIGIAVITVTHYVGEWIGARFG